MRYKSIACTLISLSASAMLTISCGSNKDSEENGSESTSTTYTATSYAIESDSEVSLNAISQITDESQSQLAADTETSSLSLSNPQLNSSGVTETENVRTCTANSTDGSVVIDLKRSYDIKKEISGSIRTATVEGKKSSTQKRTWKKTGQTLSCTSNAQHVNLKNIAMTQVSLKQEFERNSEYTRTITNNRRGTSSSVSTNYKASGKRETSWLSETSSSSEITLERSTTSEVTRSFSGVNKKSKNFSLDVTIKSKEGAPILSTIIRSSSDKSWKSKTIKSGTLISQFSDGTRIEQIYNNLKFTISNTCVAESGSITGAIYKGASETIASKTYSISFADGIATITYGDGTTSEFSPQGCDLDYSESSAE